MTDSGTKIVLMVAILFVVAMAYRSIWQDEKCPSSSDSDSGYDTPENESEDEDALFG